VVKKYNYKKRDPHYAREESKYAKPIPSREYILQYMEEVNQPVSRHELLNAFNLNDEEDQVALKRRLIAMLRDGQIISNRRGRYALVQKLEMIRGRVVGHKSGNGFVVCDTEPRDIFLSPNQMRGVFPGDIILVQVIGIDQRGRKEGRIAEILEHNTQQIVGRYFAENGVGFVEAEQKTIKQDVLIPKGAERGAKHGQFVVVDIISQPTFRRQAAGRIIEVLGDHMAPGMEIDVAVRSFNIPFRFATAIQKQVTKLPTRVTEQDTQGRKDLTKLALVTIDGEDAKDFDDAVYCEPHPKGGWRLLVAIADVSHYVKPGSALDKAAFERGNSVYFPGQVVPMLPEALSNDLCSLNPHLPRLCMVCDMRVDTAGKVTRYQFYRAVMRSHARLTYTEVAQALEGQVRKRLQPLLVHLQHLHKLFRLLTKQREQRGALSFETIETQIVFGKHRKIKKIVPVERNVAHMIIEECMLLANVCALRYLQNHKMPAMFRVHEAPSEEKLTILRDFLKPLGLRLTGKDQPRAMDYAHLLKRIEGRADKNLIQTVLLRSLMQATYSLENKGHFALAYPVYGHFTSPIRRYPDLFVHRAIGHVIDDVSAQQFDVGEYSLKKLAEHCSTTERRADEAVREVVDWLKCEYMQDKLGETFDGIITDVTGFGVFIGLQSVYVEGLVHITALKNDYYRFDAQHHRLVGERTGKVYRLGDRIRVRVARVDLDAREIDFEVV